MAQRRSGIFSLFSNLRKSADRSEMETLCYTLYVHYEESDDIEELEEPAAFQIPVEMKWKDLQDLIITEGNNAPGLKFIYYDDEQDEIRIDSQEEYETALHICRKEKRDLHIYKLDPKAKPKRVKRKKRKSIQKRKTDEEYAVVPEPVENLAESPVVLQPPSFEEAVQNRNEPPEPDAMEELSLPEETPVSSLEGAVGGEPDVPTQDSVVSSSVGNDEEETTPMSPSNSLLHYLQKEIRDVVKEELNDVWRFVNALKRDLNNELDVIGEQLATHSAQLPEVQRQIQELLRQKIEASKEASTSDSEASDKADEKEKESDLFAASFICESHPDGSIVHTGEGFKKHWVFKNDGTVQWNESTKLHLLDENCDPPVDSGTSLSEWGAKNKSVAVPSLKPGGTGVVCAEHLAPAHGCNYNSSWRMSHLNNPFGPRVWCNVRVHESGSSVDAQTRSLESYVELTSETLKKTTEKDEPEPEDLNVSLVPEDKVKVEEHSPKADDAVHNDHTILSFNMDDISDGAKHIETPKHETAPYNPAVTSVENQNAEEEKEDIGASVDGDDHSNSSSTPVLVTPPAEPEQKLETTENFEEPRIDTDDSDDDKDLYSSKYEENPDHDGENVENFTEPGLRTPDTEYSSAGEEQADQQKESETEVTGHEGNADDLHSVDYNVDDEPASMMSYASDFVVVPLPDCFDVNKPLNVSEYEEKEEADTMTEKQDPAAETAEPPNPPEPEPQLPPEPESSDSETESQPSYVSRNQEYHSEDSIASTVPKGLLALAPLPDFQPTPSQSEPPKSDPPTPQPDSPDDDSITDRMTKEFDAFLSNPENPIAAPSKPKVPMNQMPSTRPKIQPQAPKPVPDSVLKLNDPYIVPNANSPPNFPPFEQGWRRNPLPVPTSVISNDPWPARPIPAPRVPQLPRSEVIINQNSNGIQSTFPIKPFAVASPSESLIMDDPVLPRSSSPSFPMEDDFYPAGLEPAGSNQNDDEDFSTPPPSPPPSMGAAIELSPLDKLYEMGFHDIELNKEIFEKCENDLNRAVQALVLRAQADQEMMT